MTSQINPDPGANKHDGNQNLDEAEGFYAEAGFQERLRPLPQVWQQ